MRIKRDPLFNKKKRTITSELNGQSGIKRGIKRLGIKREESLRLTGYETGY